MNKTLSIGLALAAGIGAIIAIWQLKQCPASQDAGLRDDHWDWSDRVPLEIRGPNDDGVRDSISEANRRIGCALFRWVPAGPADIVIVDAGETVGETGVQAPTPGKRTAETAWLKFDPNAELSPFGLIELHNVITPNGRYLAVAHGLTHVLGLAHDRATNSVAHQYTLDYAEAFPMPGFSDQDAGILRDKYCHLVERKTP